MDLGVYEWYDVWCSDMVYIYVEGLQHAVGLFSSDVLHGDVVMSYMLSGSSVVCSLEMPWIWWSSLYTYSRARV